MATKNKSEEIEIPKSIDAFATFEHMVKSIEKMLEREYFDFIFKNEREEENGIVTHKIEARKTWHEGFDIELSCFVLETENKFSIDVEPKNKFETIMLIGSAIPFAIIGAIVLTAIAAQNDVVGPGTLFFGGIIGFIAGGILGGVLSFILRLIFVSKEIRQRNDNRVDEVLAAVGDTAKSCL